jgi:hypothetical protein
MPGGRPITHTLEEINANIDKYLEEAKKENKYSLAGLAIALGVDIETLALWDKGYRSHSALEADRANEDNPVEGYRRQHDIELVRAIKRAKTHILKWLTENSNSQRQSKDIFLLKNWFGYADKQEQEITVTGNIRFSMGNLDELAK